MSGPFSKTLRPCVVAPRTLAGELRRTDKQAIAFAQHLAHEADAAGTLGGFEFLDMMQRAVDLNRCVRRNEGVRK